MSVFLSNPRLNTATLLADRLDTCWFDSFKKVLKGNVLIKFFRLDV